MLYVNILINDHPLIAFVDSGAQSTIMSARCAERCGLMRLLDIRFSGQARGVGTARILGRIHIAQMKFGKSYFPISITIIENNDVDFLFGLDMLKRYRCCIDLSRNALRILVGESSYEELNFLSDNEIAVAKESIVAIEAAVAAAASSGASSSSGSLAMDVGDSSGLSSAAIAVSSNLNAAGSGNSSSSSSSSSSNNSSSGHSAEQILTLVGLGFTQNEAIAALEQSNGDVNLAATLLMASK
jgi:DNA damage-inducible protein 1